MTQPGTDKHEGGITVWESPHHASPAADLPVESFNDVVGADSRPVLVGECRVSKCFLQPILYLFAASGSFISRRAVTTSRAFAWAAALLSWAWIALSILATSFPLVRGTQENTLR